MEHVPLDIDKVRRAAVSLGIDSVSELARRSGINRPHLSRILSGKRAAMPSHAVALAKALKCDPDDIKIKAPAA